MTKNEQNGVAVVEYITVRQAAEKWSRSIRWIQVLCEEERIPGVVRPGRDWLIPADAAKPPDARVKSGKYQKRPKAERPENDEAEKRE